MAKGQVSSIPTAATFSTNGKKGKPSRPKGMSDSEWGKVIANLRMPKLLKSMEAVARMVNAEGLEFTDKQKSRMLNDIEARYNVIRQAFENPEAKVVKVASKYFA